jgi:hypothetical protein
LTNRSQFTTLSELGKEIASHGDAETLATGVNIGGLRRPEAELVFVIEWLRTHFD